MRSSEGSGGNREGRGKDEIQNSINPSEVGFRNSQRMTQDIVQNLISKYPFVVMWTKHPDSFLNFSVSIWHLGIAQAAASSWQVSKYHAVPQRSLCVRPRALGL